MFQGHGRFFTIDDRAYRNTLMCDNDCIKCLKIVIQNARNDAKWFWWLVVID